MITLHGLSKKYDHRGIAGVKDIDLQLRKGDVLALIGPNGSGKTTLLNLMAGNISPDKGEIQLKGTIKLCDLKTPETNMNVQKFLISKIVSTVDDEKKIQLTRDLADIFEFTFQLRQDLIQLSSGQKQKVLLAAELINNPECLLLDEPFAHLDPFTRNDILKQLFSYIKQRELTVVWVTHELNEAMEFSTRLALMNFGQIEQTGTPEELVFAPRNLFVAQFMGHKNFIHMKDVHKLWKSSFMESEAYLVIPPESWKIDESSLFEVKIEESRIKDLKWQLTVMRNDQRFTVHLKESEYKRLPGKGLIKLSPFLEDCFLLPL